MDDPELRNAWCRLETTSGAFPQSTYLWCATWWKHLSGKRELHVVVVLGDDGQAVAIAPLCIERRLGITFLRLVGGDSADAHAELVEKLLEEHDATMLSELKDSKQRKAVELAHGLCKRAIMRHLLFFGRYSLALQVFPLARTLPFLPYISSAVAQWRTWHTHFQNF